MLKIIKQSGFASFTEIVITSIIFLITAVGIYATLSKISPQAATATRQLEAANIGRSTVENLLAQVSADTWSGNSDLIPGVNRSFNVGMIQVNYYLQDVSDPGYAPEEAPRQLFMTITY